MPAIEQIPDPDGIHRQIDFPSMYNDAKEMIWENIFQFPGSAPESIVWSKYAATDADVHRLGREREASTRNRKPEMRYIGFITSTAGQVRDITISAGHGFSVMRTPSEGLHHAQICYRPGGNRRTDQLKRGEKNELKLALRGVFG